MDPQIHELVTQVSEQEAFRRGLQRLQEEAAKWQRLARQAAQRLDSLGREVGSLRRIRDAQSERIEALQAAVAANARDANDARRERDATAREVTNRNAELQARLDSSEGERARLVKEVTEYRVLLERSRQFILELQDRLKGKAAS